MLHRCAPFNVRDCGAVGDGTNKNTVAFQKALDACAVNGGGEVLVLAGNYLIVSGYTNNFPMIDVRWEGRWQPGRRAMI